MTPRRLTVLIYIIVLLIGSVVLASTSHGYDILPMILYSGSGFCLGMGLGWTRR